MVDKTTNANSKDAIGLEQKIRYGYFWNKHFCMYVSDYYNYYFFWFLLVTVDRDIINFHVIQRFWIIFGIKIVFIFSVC